ncbi:amidohydrolase [Maribacter sp. 2307ULW6-5]|uniref:amidohydrolase n=1 Tax=Maribacter sp. 2307ULW6-5 TaxID=3386275 RepID=UPI0039BD5ACC
MEHRLQVALVQTPLHWEAPGENRRMLARKLKELASGVDLVVLPEMFTTGFTMFPENVPGSEGAATLAWMRHWANEKHVALLGSIIYQEGHTYFNRLFFVEPNGKQYQYDKRHTFTLAGEHKKYERGTERITITYKGFVICPLICYDLRFPVWSRNTEHYDVLVYVANWPKPRINAWDALLKARAIENMAYAIGVNRTGEDGNGHAYPGHSAAYDVLGKELVFSRKEEILYTSLSLKKVQEHRKKLGFLEDRDSFTLGG